MESLTLVGADFCEFAVFKEILWPASLYLYINNVSGYFKNGTNVKKMFHFIHNSFKLPVNHRMWVKDITNQLWCNNGKWDTSVDQKRSCHSEFI